MSNGIALLNNKLKDQGHQLEVLAQVLLVRCPIITIRLVASFKVNEIFENETCTHY